VNNYVSFRLNYRPIRIGWVITDPNPKWVEQAVRLSSCLWGGRYNPIIPAKDLKTAKSIINKYGVDLLWPIDGVGSEAAILAKHFLHLEGGFWARKIFETDPDEQGGLFLDVIHATLKAQEAASRLLQVKNAPLVISEFAEDDFLRTAMLCHFGGYPDPSETGIDYRGAISRILEVQTVSVSKNQPVPPDILKNRLPIQLTQQQIQQWWHEDSRAPGIFYGDCQSFDDLVAYWNIRAAGAPLVFFDPKHTDRLKPYVDAFISNIKQDPNLYRDREKQFILWGRRDLKHFPLDLSGLNVYLYEIERTIWIDSVSPQSTKSDQFDQDALPIFKNHDQRKASIAVSSGPFVSDYGQDQYYILLIEPSEYGSPVDDYTFAPPNISHLNKYIGQYFFRADDEVRSDEFYPRAFGLVLDVQSKKFEIDAVPVFKLFSAIFEKLDLSLTQSDAGLVSKRLIQQIGGPQGARVFKIRGARSLLRSTKLNSSFTRSHAIQAIRGFDANRNVAQFDEHKHLYIIEREEEHLKPEDVFTYLLEKRVYRAGIEPLCPHCLLHGWHHVNDLKSIITCEYCGNDFDLTIQLKDRGDWRFRRSGLFGRDEDQRGGIPVALTIQQLDASIRETAIYSAGVQFSSRDPSFEDCEVDLLAMIAPPFKGGRWQFLIAECKSDGGEIDEDDIRKLRGLAKVVEQHGYDCFIMFSKTSEFTADEIDAMSSLIDFEKDHRLILWNRDHLEPYDAYEKFKDRLDDKYFHSLYLMANATVQLYFKHLD